MQGDTGSFSSSSIYDRSVEFLCSRRAEHTYEVTIASQSENDDLNYPSSVVDIWPEDDRKTIPPSIANTWQETQENTFYSRGELDWLPTGTQRWDEPATDFGSHFQQPLSLPYSEAARNTAEVKPRHVPPRPTFYFDPHRCQYRTSKQEKCFREDFGRPKAKPIKTVREKLVEFVETEDFDDYSFLALMALLMAHMFRLTKEVFGMWSCVRIIVSIFICVWRFMVIKVDDILETDGSAQVALKCAILTMEVLVIFVCIFVFFWAILIPVYHLFTNILSKIFYFFP